MKVKQMAFIQNKPKFAKAAFIFAHGAGAPMDSPFMNTIAEGLAVADILVVRFEFPYMAQRRVDGKKRGPGRAEKLMDDFLDVVSEIRAKQPKTLPIFIGGKSMGGRIASMIADECNVKGVICLGYPFHPPGKPENLRTAHLETIKTPVLICQGERDSFGSKSEIADYDLSNSIKLVWLPDGDHSLKPRKSSGYSEAQNLSRTCEEIDAFITAKL
ncbi:MAG: alpha/beta family hydrolase [Pyrinomonadaceae bacterium]